jgi:hypothetical protein
MMQIIYGPKFRYCVVKVEREKFDGEELYELHHLNLISAMPTDIYTYTHDCQLALFGYPD